MLFRSTSTLSHKFLGSNSSNNSGQKQQKPSNQQQNLPGAVGDILGKITTTIGNKLNPSGNPQQNSVNKNFNSENIKEMISIN